MGQLRVTPEQLMERAQEYNTQGEAVGEVIAALDNLISALENEWEGNKASKYISQYSELRPSFKSMEELVLDLSSTLKAIALGFEEADS